MDERLVRHWVDALRSGEWPQGTAYLSQNSEYCCLGVLNEISGNPGIRRKRYDDNYVIDYADMDSCYEPVVNAVFLQSLGLNSWMVKELTEMNDLEGNTFEEIADFIEQNLLTPAN